MLLSRIRNEFRRKFQMGFEVNIIRLIKYFSLFIGIIGIWLMANALFEWKIISNNHIEVVLKSIEDDANYSTAMYFIILGFNSFGLFYYLQETVIARDSATQLLKLSRQDNLRLLHDMRNTLIDNMKFSMYKNIEKLSFNQLMEYPPSDRITLAYLKLRWMDKMQLKGNKSFSNKIRQKWILQIYLDEKTLGFTNLIVAPKTFDTKAVERDLDNSIDTVKVPRPKSLDYRAKNSKKGRI